MTYIFKYCIAFLLVCITLAGCSTHASNWKEWDTEKRTVFVASNIAIAADWGSTLNLTERYDENYHERNPILGRHPSRGDVNKYFVARTMLNYQMARYLPDPWDKWSLSFTTIVHSKAASDNIGLGLEIDF